jgi:hypothetical protein
LPHGHRNARTKRIVHVLLLESTNLLDLLLSSVQQSRGPNLLDDLSVGLAHCSDRRANVFREQLPVPVWSLGHLDLLLLGFSLNLGIVRLEGLLLLVSLVLRLLAVIGRRFGVLVVLIRGKRLWFRGGILLDGRWCNRQLARRDLAPDASLFGNLLSGLVVLA